MATLFGGRKNSGAEEVARQNAEIAAANQRRSLAQMAAQQAEADQATSTPGRRRRSGSQMLTFLTGAGQDTLG